MTNSQLRKVVNRSLWRSGFPLISLVFGCLVGLSSLAIAQEQQTLAVAQEQQTPDVTTRFEASLEPVMPVDVSGDARLDNEVGTANDHFTAEVEISKADFAELGITRANGFRDEVVELRVLRGGVVIFTNRLHFAHNLVEHITFETNILGTAAPELRGGDVARVWVNGHFTLRGRFQVH